MSAASASRDTIQLEFWKATSDEGCKLIYKDNDLKDKNKLFAKNPPPPPPCSRHFFPLNTGWLSRLQLQREEENLWRHNKQTCGQANYGEDAFHDKSPH